MTLRELLGGTIRFSAGAAAGVLVFPLTVLGLVIGFAGGRHVTLGKELKPSLPWAIAFWVVMSTVFLLLVVAKK